MPKSIDKGADESAKRTYVKVPEDYFESEQIQRDFYDEIVNLLLASANAQPLKELTNSGYRVMFSGSSIFGVMDSPESWSRVQEFLAKKLAQDKIKCFRWWCKACIKFPLVFEEDLPEHVTKISFPNVIKLIEGAPVAWLWQEPLGEWARAHGSAADAFADLVERKSRPSWVVSISKPGLSN